MGRSHKIIWHEGMFLTPHHFQQWDRYYEQLLQERLRVVRPFGWGVTDIRVDMEDLANGIVHIVALQGVMPDGVAIQILPADTGNGLVLAPRSIDRWFPPSLDHLDVFVGIPAERPEGPTWMLDETTGAAPTRYVGLRVSVADFQSGEKREIVLARENFRLLFSGEDASGYVSLKLLELERASGGRIALRESYVPPCLSIGASPWLSGLLRSLLELLSAKRKALAAQQSTAGPVGLDQMRCARLHILNAHLAVLAHYSEVGQAHPETLYLMLAALTGELSTVCPMLDPMEIPKYDHFNLQGTFREMERRIRQALKEEESRTETFPLTLTRECIWEGVFADDQVLQSGHLYLATGSLGDEHITKFVKQIRVAAPAEVDNIVNGALGGLGLMHVPSPPSTMPVTAGHKYFRLEHHDPLWPAIARARAIALYVPPTFKDVKLELVWTK